jgi:hypothetical protein
MRNKLTDNHGGKREAFPNTLPMHLVGQIGEANIAHEFFANDINTVGLRVWNEGRIGAIGHAG